MGKVFSDFMEWLESVATAVLNYQQGKPSLLRLVTIPIGALITGAGIALTGLVVEYGDLAADFKKARQAKKV